MAVAGRQSLERADLLQLRAKRLSQTIAHFERRG